MAESDDVLNSAVIDASVAVKWVVMEDLGAEALQVRHLSLLLAPSHWLIEATNALWAKTLRGELSASEAEERAATLALAPVTAVPLQPLLAKALRLALELRHPVYDCLYLALAEERGVPVVTADRRFLEVVRRTGRAGAIIWLKELSQHLGP